MRRKRKRIALDCDGILGDFNQASLNLIYELTGERFVKDDVTKWDLFDSLGKKDIEHKLHEAVAAGGWCLNIPVLPGAQEAVEKLQSIGEVIIVTSPLNVRGWVPEREEWLKKHFGIPRKRIIHASGKAYVAGDFLVDDKTENCVEWLSDDSYRKSLLWDTPYNTHDRFENDVFDQFRRVYSWDEVIAIIGGS